MSLPIRTCCASGIISPSDYVCTADEPNATAKHRAAQRAVASGRDLTGTFLPGFVTERLVIYFLASREAP